jgi:hypothetical protein
MEQINLKDHVREAVKANVREQAIAIHDLKVQAKVERDGKVIDHISPHHKAWRAYTGRKREATLWLAAVHAMKATDRDDTLARLKQAFPKQDVRFLRLEARRRVAKIMDAQIKALGLDGNRKPYTEVVYA